MGFAVREVTLEFGSAAQADGWVAAHVPAGLVVGSIRWQLVIHQPGSTSVRLLQGFGDLEGAGDWQTAVLPELDGATSMTVTLGEAEAYVGGNAPAHEGPGRVWLVPPAFPGQAG